MKPNEQEKSELMPEIAKVVEQIAQQKDKAARRWSPHTSVGLRLAGLFLSVFLAIVFERRNYLQDLEQTANAIPDRLDWVIIGLGLILIPIFIFIEVRRFVRHVQSDRVLTPKAILSNWFYVIVRPMFTYLLWTSVFNIWPGINAYGFRYVVLGFIIGSTLRMKYKDRNPVLSDWQDEPNGQNPWR